MDSAFAIQDSQDLIVANLVLEVILSGTMESVLLNVPQVSLQTQIILAKQLVQKVFIQILQAIHANNVIFHALLVKVPWLLTAQLVNS